MSETLAGCGFARFRLIYTRTPCIPRLPGIPELIPFPKPHSSLLTQSGFKSSLPGKYRVNPDMIAIPGSGNRKDILATQAGAAVTCTIASTRRALQISLRHNQPLAIALYHRKWLCANK